MRGLASTWTCYRIGDPRGEFPIFSDRGARELSGRWHTAPAPIIYAARHYSTALLEKLVHHEGELPRGQHYVKITLPRGLSYEVLNPDTLPGWHEADGRVARRFGDNWLREGRSAVLIVPSVAARLDSNVLINTGHEGFTVIEAGLETPIWWDERLFR